MASQVVGKVNAISLKFKWEIENFCITCKNVGDSLKSPKFTANSSNNVQWFLDLYPKGETEDCKDYLSLFLWANTNIKTGMVNLKIVNNNGEVVAEKNMAEQIFTTDNGRGYSKFISRNFVQNPLNRILNEDALTIVCKITYTDNKIIASPRLRVIDSPTLFIPPRVKKEVFQKRSRLEDEYEALINDSNFSDVSLISEGKEVKVHKCILAKSSSVFSAMFNAKMKEKQENTVEIVDIKYDVLVEMIRFVYARKVNNIDTLAGDLAVAADKYALDGLKNTCERTIIKNLSVENVIGCLQLADNLRMEGLKDKAIEFIVENASDISDKPEFEMLPHDIVCKVFRCLSKKNK